MAYDKLVSDDSIARTEEGLKARRFDPVVVESGAEAMELIKTLIPKGASVMNGSSVTLEQIGFVDFLKAGEHGWKNSHAAILAEKDPQKRAELRKSAVTADYYLGSVHALTEGGEMVIGSNTGSQQPHLAFTSANLILVVSAQKIVPTLDEAMKRLHEHVIPLEDVHMKQLYGPESGTMLNKTLILHGESPMTKRNAKVIIVKEKLGF